ncbi:major facilitator superfamily domain-containing protein [Aspergillus cavernicola]|uniref:Major facilitator superfamily domain-containing protein n=1 Tax=Aspergillus cavernicola TaxID=176166 RepID=A0ABR4HUY8_9EURO
MSSTAEKTKSGEQPDDYADAESNFQPKSPKFWLIMSGMYLSVFLVALDRTIIATAIPAISNEFHSINDIGWYGSAYMLTGASFNPVFGRIYQLYSTKWTFLSSIVIFEVGSAICGAAPTSTAFIIGRSIAGIGSAGIFSGGMMIIIPLVPLRKRPMFTSIFGMTFALSSVIAPIIGGAFTDKVTWRWCFYLNLPIGGFTIIALLLFFHVPSPQRSLPGVMTQIKHLDPLGVFLFIPSIVCLILALEWGGSAYAWSAPKMIGLLVTFAVLLVLFGIVEVLTPETAMIPTRVVLNRSIASSMLFMFLISGAMMSVVYYLNIWFQVVKGDSATRAGISTIPMVLSLVIMSVLSAAFTQRIGYYVPSMLIAPVLCSIGGGLLSTLSASSNHRSWIGYQVVFGLGIGCGFQTSNLAAQAVLPRVDVPIGMALMFFMQQLGGAILLAVDQNLLTTKLVGRLSHVAGLDAEAIINTGATDIRDMVPSGELDTVVGAYNYALTRIFIVTAALSACAILGALAVEWRSIKTGGPKGSAATSENVSDENRNDVEKGNRTQEDDRDQPVDSTTEPHERKLVV